MAAAALGAVLGLTPCARAAVSSEEAQQLNANLTRMGAERAGNAQGTIPAWTGGYTTPIQDYQQGRPRPDPFSGEKPLFSITATNLSTYAAKLPEGAKALFAKFPDYRMDIYPTHRKTAAPQWVYDNISRNATRAHAAPAGIAYCGEGAAGGISFSISQDGLGNCLHPPFGFLGPGT